MAKKGIFRRIGERITTPIRMAAAKIFRKPEPPKPEPKPAVPPKPTVPPHPRKAVPSPMPVDERVRRYKALTPPQRVEQRPEDEESLFWRLYDQGV